METPFLIIFCIIVTWFFLSYKNLGNLEFVMFFVVFILYLMYLTGYRADYMPWHATERFVVQEESDYVVQEEGVGGNGDPDDIILNNYVGFLRKMKDQYNSIASSSDNTRSIFTLPSEVKNRVVPEFNRLIGSINPKDPNGLPQETVSIDKTTFPEVTSEDVYVNIRNEYFVIDKVFRDLNIVDPAKYKSMFYTS